MHQVADILEIDLRGNENEGTPLQRLALVGGRLKGTGCGIVDTN